MIRIVLKLLVYLSILTSTRTTSSYLDPQSLVNFRRSSVSAQQQQLQPLGPEIYERDAYEWQPISEKVDESSSYFIPRLVNANSMVYTQLSNIENKRPNNKKSRKSKKGSGSKQLYENHIKRKSNLSFNVDHSLSSSSNSNNNDEGDVAFVKEIVKHSNNNTNQPSNQTMATNEYPAAKIDPQHERELQELFGIEGARKYQEYQLKQQMLNQQLDIKQDDIKDVPQKKRDSSLGAAEEMQDVSGAMINQMMSRTTRRQREYDVPLIREYHPS